MTRLYVVAEGLTEANFVSRIVKPHVESKTAYTTTVSAPILNGYRSYADLRKFVKTLLHSPSPDLRVTTMIDLFKLAGDFPGRAELAEAPPLERVRYLEHRFGDDIGDDRFHPSLQLHEFEALVLVGLPILAEQHPNRRRKIAGLAARLEKKYEGPEYVDGVRPPSYWIKDAVPEYNKPVDGVITTTRIGLPRLCERREHFRQWLDYLESPQAPNAA